MYAIIKTGGKQQKVSPGDLVKVEKLEANPGEEYSFNEVTLVENNGSVTVGTPLVKAKVTAQVLSQGRGKKLVVFFYRHKTNHRRRKGHRQSYTQLRIKDIVMEA